MTPDLATYGVPAEVADDHLELPQELVGAAGFGNEVALVGVFDKAEVWDPHVWAAEVEQAERDPHRAETLRCDREIRPAVWIGGGRPFGEARPDMLVRAARHVRHAVLIGEHAQELTARFPKLGIAHSVAANMREAVVIAAQAAERGDTVLLAPGYASYDMYEDHAHRSWAFSCTVASLPSNPAP